jgi:hypothetical protein
MHELFRKISNRAMQPAKKLTKTNGTRVTYNWRIIGANRPCGGNVFELDCHGYGKKRSTYKKTLSDG